MNPKHSYFEDIGLGFIIGLVKTQFLEEVFLVPVVCVLVMTVALPAMVMRMPTAEIIRMPMPTTVLTVMMTMKVMMMVVIMMVVIMMVMLVLAMRRAGIPCPPENCMLFSAGCNDQ